MATQISQRESITFKVDEFVAYAVRLRRPHNKILESDMNKPDEMARWPRCEMGHAKYFELLKKNRKNTYL